VGEKNSWQKSNWI